MIDASNGFELSSSIVIQWQSLIPDHSNVLFDLLQRILEACQVIQSLLTLPLVYNDNEKVCQMSFFS